MLSYLAIEHHFQLGRKILGLHRQFAHNLSFALCL